MNFTFPLALILLLLIPYFVWVGRPTVRRASPRQWREWTSLALRILILLLLTLSLAGTQLVRASDELAVVFLIDASDSMTAEQLEEAEVFVRTAVETMPITDEAAVVVFGTNALVDRPMSGLAELAPIQSIPQQLQTNLAEAIRLGVALFPAGRARRLVILSDGAATVGDAVQAAELAAASLPGITRQLAAQRDRLELGLRGRIPGLTVNAASSVRLPNTASVNFPGLIGAELLDAIPELCASTGAACHSGTTKLSATLAAMGVPEDVARGAVRLSVGRSTTDEEIDTAVDRLAAVWQKRSRG